MNYKFKEKKMINEKKFWDLILSRIKMERYSEFLFLIRDIYTLSWHMNIRFY